MKHLLFYFSSYKVGLSFNPIVIFFFLFSLLKLKCSVEQANNLCECGVTWGLEHRRQCYPIRRDFLSSSSLLPWKCQPRLSDVIFLEKSEMCNFICSQSLI